MVGVYLTWGKGWLRRRRARKIEERIAMRKLGGEEDSVHEEVIVGGGGGEGGNVETGGKRLQDRSGMRWWNRR